MAEVVGTAYVRIRAITTGLGKDIKDGLDSGMGGADFDLPQDFKDNINKGMEEAGEEGGERYSKGLRERSKKDSDKNSKSILKSFSNSLKKNPIPGKVWAIALGLPGLGAIIKLASSYIITLLGQVGYLATAAVGLGSAAAGGFAAIAAGILPLVLAFKTESEAMDVFTESIQANAEAWREVGTQTQSTLLPRLDQAYETLGRLTPLFGELGQEMGTIVGRLAEGAANLLTSDDALADWGVVFENAEAIFRRLKNGLLDIVGILPGFFAATAPLATQLADSLGKAMSNFADFIEAGLESGTLTENLGIWYERAESIGRSIWNIIEALWEIFTVGGTTVSPMFETLEATTQRWVDYLRSAEGEGKLKALFDAALPVAQEVNGLIGDIVELIGSKITAPGGTEGIIGFIQSLRTDFLPALATLAEVLGENLASGLGDLAIAFVELITALAESGALGTFTRVLGDFIEQLVELMKIPGVADVVAKLAIAFATWSAIKFAAKPFVAFAEGIGGFVKGAEKFANSNFLKILKTGGISGLLRTLGTSIATFGATLWGAITPLLPIIAIIAAIIAVAYGIYWAIKNWDKILPVLKDVWESISTFFIDLWESISNFFEGIGDTIAEAWTSFIDFFQELPGKIAEAWTALIDFFQQIPAKIGEFFLGVGQAILTFVAGIPGFLFGAAQALVQWIFDAIPLAISFLGEWIGKILGFLLFLGPRIFLFMVQASQALWQWIKDAVPAALKWLGDLWVTIYTWLLTTVRNIVVWGVQALQAFIQWVVDAPGHFVTWLANTWNTILTWLGETASNLITKGKELLTNFIQWIVDAARDAPAKLAQFASTVWTWITEFVGGLPGRFIDAITSFAEFGSELFGKIGEGLSSALDIVVGWGKDLWAAIKRGILSVTPSAFKSVVTSLLGGGAAAATATAATATATAGVQTMAAGIRAGGGNLSGAIAPATMAGGGGGGAAVMGFGMSGLMAAAVPSTVSAEEINQFTRPQDMQQINLVVQIGETDITEMIDARISNNDRATAQALWIRRR